MVELYEKIKDCCELELTRTWGSSIGEKCEATDTGYYGVHEYDIRTI